MKKFSFYLIAFTLAYTFQSCEKTQDEILRDMIEEKIISTLDDPDSYEFASISQTDSVMSVWENEEDAKKIKISLSMNEAQLKALNAKANNPNLSYKQRLDAAEKGLPIAVKIDSLNTLYVKNKMSYRPYLTGYYTIFKYRCKNEFGAKVLNSAKVVLNIEKTEIKEIMTIE